MQGYLLNQMIIYLVPKIENPQDLMILENQKKEKNQEILNKLSEIKEILKSKNQAKKEAQKEEKKGEENGKV